MTSALDPNLWGLISIAVAIAIILIIVGMAWLVGLRLWNDKAAFEGLLHEPTTAKASLSRFQFLIFTFVIAGLYLGLCLESGTMIDVPDSVLWLLGISGGSYVASKGVGRMMPPDPEPEDPLPEIEVATLSRVEEPPAPDAPMRPRRGG